MARLAISPKTEVDLYLTALGHQNFKAFAGDFPSVVKYSIKTSELWDIDKGCMFIRTPMSVYWKFLHYFRHVKSDLMVEGAFVGDDLSSNPFEPLPGADGPPAWATTEFVLDQIGTQSQQNPSAAPDSKTATPDKVVVDEQALDLFFEAIAATPNWGFYLYKYDHAKGKTDYSIPLDPELALPAHRDQLRHILEAFLQAELEARLPLVQSTATDSVAQVPSIKQLVASATDACLSYEIQVDELSKPPTLELRGPITDWTVFLQWLRQWKP